MILTNSKCFHRKSMLETLLRFAFFNMLEKLFLENSILYLSFWIRIIQLKNKVFNGELYRENEKNITYRR